MKIQSLSSKHFWRFTAKQLKRNIKKSLSTAYLVFLEAYRFHIDLKNMFVFFFYIFACSRACSLIHTELYEAICFLFLIFSARLVQLFRRILQRCSAVKLQKCFVD